jgi:hypothetical protein
MKKMTDFAVVIETDSYAGNFEREMCAYVTGHIGECEVGDEFVDQETESLFDGYIERIPDENGCYRPVSLGCDVSDDFNLTSNDVVIWFNQRPTDYMVNFISERLKTFVYNDETPKIYKVYTIQTNTNITIEKIS